MDLLDPLDELVAPYEQIQVPRRAVLNFQEAMAYGLYKKSDSKRPGRVTNVNANEPLPVSPMPTGEDVFEDNGLVSLKDVEDGRTFDPLRFQRYSRLVQGTPARVNSRDEITRGIISNPFGTVFMQDPHPESIVPEFFAIRIWRTSKRLTYFSP